MRSLPWSAAAALWVGVVFAGSDGAPPLAWIAVGVALAPSWALVTWLSRTIGEEAEHCLGPMRWLALAPLARVLPLPFLPAFIGVAVAVSVAMRVATSLRPPPEPAPSGIAEDVPGGEAGPSPLAENRRRRSRLEIAALLLLLLPGLVLFQTTVVHDAFQYQATAVSVLNGDYDLFEELFLHNSHRSYNPYAEGSIRYLGVPLLEIPGIALASWLTPLWPDLHRFYPIDGFSQPYALAISVTSCLFGVAGLLLIYVWVRRHYGRKLALAALALTLWASPLPFFLFLWHGWTHTYSICLSALFLLMLEELPRPYEGDYARSGHSPTVILSWLGLGLIAGLLALIWPINGLILAVPGVEILARLRRRPLAVLTCAAAMAAGMAIGFLPQLAGWYGATGHPLGATYAKVGDYFDWWNPHLAEILFSTVRHGLFAWHPLLLPGFLGLAWAAPARLRLGLITWVVAQILVMSCWSVWWTGIGFGNRFFLNLLPAAALGFAGGLRWTARALGPAPLGKRGSVLFGAVATLAIFGNLSLLGAYRVDAIPMGIDGPNYLQDAPSPWTDLLTPLLRTAPATLDTFTRDFWINQSFFATRLRLATLAGGEWISPLLLAFGLTAAIVLLVRAITRRRWTPESGGARSPWAVLGVCVAVLAISGWLAAVPRPTPPANEFFHFDMREELLMPYERVTLTPQGYLRPVSRIDVVSFLTYSSARPAQPVARLHIQAEGAPPLILMMRSGIDTSEVSLTLRGRGPSATATHEWLTRAGSDRLYAAHAYLAQFELPQPMRIRSIEVEMLPGAGDLVLRDVFLVG